MWPVAEFKLLLVGDSGVGKSALLQRHLTGKFKEAYTATPNTEAHTLRFETIFGPLRLNCSDIAGQSYRDSSYLGAHGAIIMFDVTSRLSYQNVPNWRLDVVRVCEDIPIVLCGNKVDDVQHRDVKPKQITFHRQKNLQYYDISVKANYQLEKPFCHLVRKIVGDDTVTFVNAIAIAPPALELDVTMLARLEVDYVAAMSAPLPEVDDEDMI
ncbi:GTP-binding nuclear protein Ran [Saprolegnia diclina VS20]|uniref:GTP-binding nuclear protein n=1 Tax=Saprolegnia diclina (strain VS20) TaxID=1156394 RepID=T0Q198_SAPDV|nr:GTP-binding nuclear protein Ran [Saprolegnia diclina VS20]EQC31609.1 GTP-binding nuclear protein Ran [Saprolegnia diclina VS20]|eukprot:XP_008615008.1 GTP-binding nuclear protein Ran [Saprolegnia diclina VS20]